MTDETDPFDLSSLRVNPSDAVLVQSASRATRRKRQFIRVPLAWSDRLAAARNAASLKVALRLLLLHFRDRGRLVRLGNMALQPVGVSRKQKLRALAELERLGLVRVERRPRKSPIVTVILDPE